VGETAQEQASLVGDDSWVANRTEDDATNTTSTTTGGRPGASGIGESDESFVSDTGHLNRERRRVEHQVLSVGSDDAFLPRRNSSTAPGHHPVQDDSRLPNSREFKIILPEKLVKIVAVTTVTHFILLNLSDGAIIFDQRMDSIVPYDPADHLGSFVNATYFTYNRLNMMEWVPQLSCLFVASQNGRVFILKFRQRRRCNGPEDERLHGEETAFSDDSGQPLSSDLIIEACSVDAVPLAPIAGFAVFHASSGQDGMKMPLPRDVWILYILYADGTRTTANISRLYTADVDLASVALL
jgi:hypothetical protein